MRKLMYSMCLVDLKDTLNAYTNLSTKRKLHGTPFTLQGNNWILPLPFSLLLILSLIIRLYSMLHQRCNPLPSSSLYKASDDRAAPLSALLSSDLKVIDSFTYADTLVG